MVTPIVKRRLIELLRTALGFDAEGWAGVLEKVVGCRRTADLSDYEADKALSGVTERAAAVGLLNQYAFFDGRDGFADGYEVGLIEFLWKSLHPGLGTKRQSWGLRQLLEETAGVSDLRFLSSNGAAVMIETLVKQLDVKFGTASESRMRTKKSS